MLDALDLGQRDSDGRTTDPHGADLALSDHPASCALADCEVLSKFAETRIFSSWCMCEHVGSCRLARLVRAAKLPLWVGVPSRQLRTDDRPARGLARYERPCFRSSSAIHANMDTISQVETDLDERGDSV